MEIKFQELLAIQKEVDEVIKEKAYVPPSSEIILAFNVEFFELINEIGIWKWWKHSHVPKRDRVLDELADCFAFYFKLINVFEKEENYQEIFDSIEEEVNKVYKTYEGFFYEDENQDDVLEKMKNLIIWIGSNNEEEETRKVGTTERFAFAIYAVKTILPDVTWEEIVDAYKKKSAINIERQRNNY